VLGLRRRLVWRAVPETAAAWGDNPPGVPLVSGPAHVRRLGTVWSASVEGTRKTRCARHAPSTAASALHRTPLM